MSGFDKNTPSLFPKEPRDQARFPDLPVEREGPGCLVQFIGGLGVAAFFASGDIGFGERLVTGAIFLFVAAVIYSFQRRNVQHSRDTVAATVLRNIETGIKSPFHLYLRPFEVTNQIRIRNMNRGRLLVTDAKRLNEPATHDLETLLAKAVWIRRPLIALGKPGESFGAGRIKTDEQEWKADITLLMQNADLIFVIPAARSGIKWELELIRDKGYLSKCIFIMPPEPQGHITFPFAEEMWNKAEPELKTIGFELPPYQRDGLLFKFDSDGKVQDTTNLNTDTLESAIHKLKE
jgi:hypothetical protein